MILYWYIDDHFVKFGYVNCDFNWLTINNFGEVINKNKNYVKTVIFQVCLNQKTCYKIYQWVLGIIHKDWKSFKITIWLMTNNFQSKINVTALDININIMAEYWSVVLSSYQLMHFIYLKMISQKIIIIGVN